MDLVLTRGREGVQNSENLTDVICEWPLMLSLFIESQPLLIVPMCNFGFPHFL